jgi:adenosylcobinamide kinase/adenosylcobinamide-phosphate guanylyltransferase
VGWSHRDIYRENIEGGAGLQPLSSVGEEAKDGADVRALTGQLLLEHPDCIIISDEIGNGIVPMEHEEREYRELTGRLLCELANKADRVERIVCGIGERIK